MAKKLNAETAADAGRNALTPEERLEKIDEVISDLALLEEERRAHNAKLSKRRKELSSVVRGELGYTMKVFQAEFMAPFKEKEDHKDQEAWDLRLQAKAEAARFLKIGEQLTLFGQQATKETRAESARARNAKGKDKTPGGKRGKKGAAAPAGESEDEFDDVTDTVAQAGVKGFDAGSAGKDKDTNPYPYGSRQYQAFNTNWTAAQSKMAEKIGRGPDARH